MPGLWEDVDNAKFPERRLRKSAASPKRKHAQQQLLERVLGFFKIYPALVHLGVMKAPWTELSFQHVAKSLKKSH